MARHAVWVLSIARDMARSWIMWPIVVVSSTGFAQPSGEPLRAIIPRVEVAPIVDGKLLEFDRAFCTPVEYFHPDWKNRAAQFFYLWDDDAFYVGVRTLDEHPFAPDDTFWVGDAVEWYFDTRSGPAARRLTWGPGAVHCFFTALDRDRVRPRFCLRPGYEDAIPQTGVQVAAQRWERGLEYEFKLPWLNFPKFQPKVGARLQLDAELSYSDGVSRSYRSFAFGSPLSVERPANLAQAELVDKYEQRHWRECGPVMMPLRVDVPWDQVGEPHVRATIAVPPNRSGEIGKVTIQLLSTAGKTIAEHDAEVENLIEKHGNFAYRTATWPSSVAAPGTYHVQAIVFNHADEELARIAPRLVSVNMEQGY